MYKKYIIVSFLLIIVLFYAGYSKKDISVYHYTFSGENDLWKAAYKVDSVSRFTNKNDTLSYKGKVKNILVTAYKGKLSDLDSVKHIEISYKEENGNGGSHSSYNEDGGVRSRIFTLQSGSNGYISFDDNEVVKVTINIDGDIQTLELKYKKNASNYLCPPGINIYF